MKEIIIDGVSYWLTPKITYKLNDWVYCTTVNEVRRIVENKNLSDKDKIFGSSCTLGAVEQWPNEYRLATQDEVKEHLFKLATFKGYKKDTIVFTNGCNKKIIKSTYDYFLDQDQLFIGYSQVYISGIWSEIVTEPIKLIPGEKYIIKHTKKFCHLASTDIEKTKLACNGNELKDTKAVFIGTILLFYGERNIFYIQHGINSSYVMYSTKEIDYVVEHIKK